MLETSRCSIINLQESDYKEVKELYSNVRVREFLGGTIGDEEFGKRFLDMCIWRRGSIYWVIRQRDTSEFIGLASLDLYHDGISTEVSYQLMPKWWGQGYGREILEYIIELAFRNIKLNKLIAETQAANKASRRLLERVGMTLEDTTYRFGKEQCIYSIFNNFSLI